jgi:hypothetical protein
MSATKTTWDDVARGRCETRRWESAGYCAAMGRSSLYIYCPFCARRVIAFVWSLSGCGKRCDCGALFGSGGDAWKREDHAG